MGGESTEISAGTTTVVIEAAYWDPTVIARTARRHKLPSEASRRFERAVDPAVAAVAAEFAAELLVALRRRRDRRPVGRSRPTRRSPARDRRCPLTEPERLMGRPYDRSRSSPAGCSRSGCAVTRRIPRRRGPVGAAAELAARPHPARRPGRGGRPAGGFRHHRRRCCRWRRPAPGSPPRQRRERLIAADLASAGLTEVLSFPFIGAAELDALGLPDGRRPPPRRWRWRNPLDADRPMMRTTLLPGLLDTVLRNLSRGTRDLRCSRSVRCSCRAATRRAVRRSASTAGRRDQQLAVLNAALPNQPRHVRGGARRRGRTCRLVGPAGGRVWADAIELARRIGADGRRRAARGRRPSRRPWHPGRCASIRVGDWPIGFAGELAPAVVERLGLPPRTAALELDLDGLPARRTAGRAGDLPLPAGAPGRGAWWSTAAVPAGRRPARRCATAAASCSNRVRLFDVYAGDQVGAGRKSLAFAMVVRAPDRTLTAADATDVRDAALAAAAERVGAALR